MFLMRAVVTCCRSRRSACVALALADVMMGDDLHAASLDVPSLRGLRGFPGFAIFGPAPFFWLGRQTRMPAKFGLYLAFSHGGLRGPLMLKVSTCIMQRDLIMLEVSTCIMRAGRHFA